MIKATYIQHCGSDLMAVNAARISFANEKTELDAKDEKLIKYLADNEHMSPFEHNSVTFLVECPLYIRSQIHRHRTFAYNEVSRRYTADNMTFYCPPQEDIRAQSKSNKQASDNPIDEKLASQAYYRIDALHNEALNTYNFLLEIGVSREQARGVLPQNLMTSFYMTGNVRNWIHFVKLRLHHHAQKEVQYVAQQVLDKLVELFPVSVKALMKEEL